MEKKEIRTLLTETTFTNLCKVGSARYSDINETIDISFTKNDIRTLISGKILEKEFDNVTLKYLLQDIGTDMIREILRRSPVFSELSYDL